MKQSKNLLYRTFAVAGAFLLLLSPVASAQNPKPLQTVIVDHANGLIWETGSQYERASLVVTSPDGTTFERGFAPGTQLWFDLLDSNGNTLQDGGYRYELLLFRTLRPQNRSEQGRDDQAGHQAEMLVDRTIGFFAMKDGFLAGGAEGGERELRPLSLNKNNAIEGSPARAPRDVCQNDDLIVDGSACVGFDCGCNTENFGFDTLRLKENNLRLHFLDTSSSASFPSNDWRIRINDSSNGGGNYFAIEDATGGRTPFLIEAGAPNDSLRVDSAGRLGIKTNNPVVEIHNVDGDTPTLRFEQNGSSGFTPQTWDVAGNEAGFFVRDVTNGSKLSFRIQPNSPDKSIFIRTNGVAIRGAGVANNPLTVFGDADFTANVGIQVTTPPSPLTVRGSGTNDEQLRLINGGDENDIAVFGVNNASDLFIQTHTVGVGSVSDIILQAGMPDGVAPGGNVGIGTSTPSEKLHVVGNICATGSIAVCSDERFKKNIKTVTAAVDLLSKLRGVEFDWRRDEFPGHQFGNDRQVGFIAQEIKSVLPSVVNKGSDGYYSVDYGRLAPVLVEAVKELSAAIEDKDTEIACEREEIDRLHLENASFRARLDRLEALIATQGKQISSQVSGSPSSPAP